MLNVDSGFEEWLQDLKGHLSKGTELIGPQHFPPQCLRDGFVQHVDPEDFLTWANARAKGAPGPQLPPLTLAETPDASLTGPLAEGLLSPFNLGLFAALGLLLTLMVPCAFPMPLGFGLWCFYEYNKRKQARETRESQTAAREASRAAMRSQGFHPVTEQATTGDFILIAADESHLALVSRSGKPEFWPGNRINDAEIENATGVIATTRGNGLAVDVGGLIVGSGHSTTTTQTYTLGVWIRVFVDDVANPVRVVRLPSIAVAKQWYGVLLVLTNRNEGKGRSPH